MEAAKVTLVNYGLGNIGAFVSIYRRLGIAVDVAESASELARAQRLILPGVGSFDWAMKRLDRSGLRVTLDKLVLDNRIPTLGVCVGMQMMGLQSEEGSLPGLGWLRADVVRLARPNACTVPLPHMGWNDVEAVKPSLLLRGLVEPRFYFLHSYCVVPAETDDVVAVASYGMKFCAALASGHIYGTQFHPEKSHHWGVKVLANFADSSLDR